MKTSNDNQLTTPPASSTSDLLGRMKGREAEVREAIRPFLAVMAEHKITSAKITLHETSVSIELKSDAP